MRRNKYQEFSKVGQVSPERTLEQELESRFSVALHDRTAEALDLHGRETADVEGMVLDFLSQNVDRDYVRIIYGKGTGQVERAVLGFLRRQMKKPNRLFEDFREDERTASCVVLMKRE